MMKWVAEWFFDHLAELLAAVAVLAVFAAVLVAAVAASIGPGISVIEVEGHQYILYGHRDLEHSASCSCKRGTP